MMDINDGDSSVHSEFEILSDDHHSTDEETNDAVYCSVPTTFKESDCGTSIFLKNNFSTYLSSSENSSINNTCRMKDTLTKKKQPQVLMDCYINQLASLKESLEQTTKQVKVLLNERILMKKSISNLEGKVGRLENKNESLKRVVNSSRIEASLRREYTKRNSFSSGAEDNSQTKTCSIAVEKESTSSKRSVRSVLLWFLLTCFLSVVVLMYINKIQYEAQSNEMFTEIKKLHTKLANYEKHYGQTDVPRKSCQNVVEFSERIFSENEQLKFEISIFVSGTFVVVNLILIRLAIKYCITALNKLNSKY